MAVSTAPGIAELLDRATGLAPRLRQRVGETQQLRRIPDATIEDLRQAGLFRVFQPARYGGFELDYGATQIDLANVLGPIDGSLAWVQSVVACHAWVLGMFPTDAQDAVWSANPDTLVASAFAPGSGRGAPVDGGYQLAGDWEFSSGVHACDWIILNVPIFGEAGPPHLIFCLVSRRDFEILDTWRSTGLRGTGSHHVRLPGAFVPAAFTLDTGLAETQQAPGSRASYAYIYRLPLWTAFPFNIAAPAIGIARGALRAWTDLTRARPDRASQPGHQVRLAEASAEVDAAEALLRADAAELKAVVAAGQPLPAGVRLRCGRDLGYAAQLCRRAVDRLMAAVGAHGLGEDSDIARARADVYAAANHVGLNWDGLAGRYGASLLVAGQAPNGQH